MNRLKQVLSSIGRFFKTIGRFLARFLPAHWPSIFGFGALIIIANLVGRIFTGRLDDGTEATRDTVELVAMVSYGAMAAVALAAGIWWGVRRRRQEIVPELLPIFVVATLWSVLLNPLFAGIEYVDIAGFFSQVLFYFVSLVAGAFIGYLIVMALGVDTYGRELKATKLAFEKKANPARA